MTMATAAYRDLLQRRRDAGYELFPVGTYDVRVVGAEKPQKGAAMGFIVQFEVLNGPHAGRKFKNWMTLSDTVIEQYPGLVDMWFREMAALGLSDAYFEAEPSDEQTIAALTGRTARVQVGRRKKKGTDDEVDDFKVFPPAVPAAPVTAPAPDPMAAPTAAPTPAVSAPVADPNAPGIPPF
jgi:hypothetical protein